MNNYTLMSNRRFRYVFVHPEERIIEKKEGSEVNPANHIQRHR